MAKDLTPDAWLASYALNGTAQVETATAAGTITGNGNAAVVITAADITGSPLSVPTAVLNTDTAATWAGKVRTALDAVSAITSVYAVGGASTTITLTRRYGAANDSTLNISLDNGTCTGITTAATSANTTAGSVGTTITIPLASITGLTAAEANTASGDIRQILIKLMQTCVTAYNTLADADKPDTLTFTTSSNLTDIAYRFRVSGAVGALVPGADV